MPLVPVRPIRDKFALGWRLRYSGTPSILCWPLGAAPMANYREGHTTEKHGTFEWIVGWEELAAHLAPPAVLGLAPGARAVDLGCGTSEVPVHLAASGYAHVLAVDRDVGCIAHMHARHGAVPGVAWRACDLVDGDLAALLPPDGKADLLLDKGTLDCALSEDTVAAVVRGGVRSRLGPP